MVLTPNRCKIPRCHGCTYDLLVHVRDYQIVMKRHFRTQDSALCETHVLIRQRRYNPRFPPKCNSCNRPQASPADVTGVVILLSRFASIVTCPQFVTRTSRDVPLCNSEAVVHLQKHCVVIFERVFRQDEHLNSLVSDVSSLSMCHNN